jgi:hypothetical protein
MTQPSVIQVPEPTVGPVVTGIDAGPGPVLVALAGAEATIAAMVLAAYTALLAKVSARLLASLPINPGLIWSLIPDWERRVDALIKELENIARMGWEAAARELGVDIPFDVTNPVLQDQLSRTRNFMVQTPDEVYRMILVALDKNAGDPAAQRAAVEDILNITGTVNWPARARTVAVTEVHRAYNFGSLAMAMNVPGSVTKVWNAKDDAATRPAHDNADGQKRNVWQPFIVGGEALMAPGDPSGSAWNVIQCRCKLSYSRSRNAS